jgi:pSer/pThr/pTyr-binding forkhead associated (FHA) protein
MVNSNFLINRLPNSPVPNGHTPAGQLSEEHTAECYSSEELDQRLGLYRVFLKLYEHHRSLLNEILDLENTDNPYLARQTWHYIQAVLQGDQVYLTTNLIQDKTQILKQAQGIWMVGRDRKAGIPIQDKRLSRRHAMIQYMPEHGFWLSDLHSTNGTYVNGEALYRARLLQDGDRVRLGNLSFMFFICKHDRTLEEISTDPLSHLKNRQSNLVVMPQKSVNSKSAEGKAENPVIPEKQEHSLPESCKETYGFFQVGNEEEPIQSLCPEPSSAQKVEILDRFLQR